MSWISKGALGAAFFIATDLAIAATTGVTGLHGIAVDLGAKFGTATGIPQPDWHALFGLEEIHHHAGHAAHEDISFTIE